MPLLPCALTLQRTKDTDHCWQPETACALPARRVCQRSPDCACAQSLEQRVRGRRAWAAVQPALLPLALVRRAEHLAHKQHSSDRRC